MCLQILYNEVLQFLIDRKVLNSVPFVYPVYIHLKIIASVLQNCLITTIFCVYSLQTEDLYEEILFEIYNNIGCENNDVCTSKLVEFVQEVFKIPNSTHEEISEIAKKKEPPKLRLNVEILKAENLCSKDSNGLSDPFVTLYLESNNSHRYNSSVKPSTLNPIWEEHFSL